MLALSACAARPLGVPANDDSGVPPNVPADDFRDECAHPATICGNECVDTTSNPSHCGACDQACGPGLYCQASACTTACVYPQVACDNACVDLREDRNNCGDCGRSCGDLFCVNGNCSCAPQQEECDGECVNTDEDEANCGLCGRSCEADEICNLGNCACSLGDTELCTDGADNDCDDVVDCEDSDCVGQKRSCTNSCGGADQQACGADGEWAECGPNCSVICVPQTVICGDGVDQDCDAARADERAPDAYEPNDASVGTPRNPGDCSACRRAPNSADDNTPPFFASFDSVDDEIDCFRFPVDDSWDPLAGESAEVTLTNIPAGHNYDLYIFRSITACETGDEAARSTRGGNASEDVDIWEATNEDDTGEYVVIVRRVEGHSCNVTDSYTLTFDGLTIF